MLKGPQGQKSPADVISRAIMFACLASGEIEELKELSGRVRSGVAGAKARAESITKEGRSAVAKQAAAARWE